MWKFTHVFFCCNIDFYPTFMCINVYIYPSTQLLKKLLNSFHCCVYHYALRWSLLLWSSWTSCVLLYLPPQALLDLKLGSHLHILTEQCAGWFIVDFWIAVFQLQKQQFTSYFRDFFKFGRSPLQGHFLVHFWAAFCNASDFTTFNIRTPWIPVSVRSSTVACWGGNSITCSGTQRNPLLRRFGSLQLFLLPPK